MHAKYIFLLVGLFSLLNVALCHITINPNGVLGCTYEHLLYSVGHAEPGYSTYKLVIQIPGGVKSVSFDQRAGWVQTQKLRNLTQSEQYFDHGKLVTTALDTITIEAESTNDLITDDEKGAWSMTLNLGNLYGDSETDTIWNDIPTVWFKTDQYIVEDSSNPKEPGRPIETANGQTLSWTGTGSGTDIWYLMKPNPSPYARLLAWNSCANRTIDWFGTDLLSPNSSTVDLATVAYVEGYVDEELLTLATAVNRQTSQLWDSKQNTNNAESVAIAGLVFGLAGFLLGAYAVFAAHCGAKTV